jgi:hypothetical protein
LLSLKTFLRQPLLHFVAIGALLFVVYDFLEPENTRVDDSVIQVNRENLLNYMQYQATAFEPELFAARFDEMNAEQKQALIDNYVREETLYREALSMELDKGDYIIRQRLIQKLDFLLEESVSQSLVPSEQDMESYYEMNKADYQIDAVYTFTHIFFSKEKRGVEEANREAEALLPTLNADQSGFNDASAYGDRYPFFQNYVERTRDYVRSNFNEAFVAVLDRTEPSTSQWFGPVTSPYGSHLVLLTTKQAPRLPELSEIPQRVLDDYRFEMIIKGRRDAEDNLMTRYQVDVE